MQKIDGSKPCGCKGCRTCLLCEKEYGLSRQNNLKTSSDTYVYCPFCQKAWPGWDINDFYNHPNHSGEFIEYPGVFIKLDFLTEEEETGLMGNLDSIPWDLSQSGRRKQNFGPKCNFKKRKLKLGDFKGFPKFSSFVQEKFKEVDLLRDFITIEQCSLEYDPTRGASIDPHIDDCWIWGERIVTVNLLSDSVLTMTINEKRSSYNLECVSDYNSCFLNHVDSNKACDYPIVRIPMPKRSLLVLFGAARYNWEHRLLREDINERRVCLAYREFTPPYLENGANYDEGKLITENSKFFET